MGVSPILRRAIAALAFFVAPRELFAQRREAPPSSGAPTTAEDSLTVVGSAPLSAASSQVVRDRDLSLRPRTRPADVFEVAPGLIVVQHAGGGKANQYFLRGFDADHGTDLALSIDDVPINLVSHGHGQGYSDPHFIISELIDRVEVREGPYFAQDGDFATAGAINLRLRETVERSYLTLEDSLVANPALGAGMFASPRLLAVLRTNAGPIRGYVAAELEHRDGPFLHPLDFNHANIVGHWGARLADGVDLALTVMSYTGAWNASGQIPVRLLNQPYEGRMFTQFDAVDPTEGGQSSRHSLSLTVHARPTPSDDLRVMLYATAYQLAIYSNFTLFLNDPVHGDQIEQDDLRAVTGLRATWRHTARVGSWQFVTSAGATLRYDDIQNGLHHTVARQRLDDLVVDHVHETALGLFAEEQIVPLPWLRLVLGGRMDTIAFDVTDLRTGLAMPDPNRNGVRQALLFSPKASLVLSPIHSLAIDLDLFANFGRGFHSNDARGTIIPSTPLLTMQCADAQHVPDGVNCPVTPMTVASGYELGARARIVRRIDVSLAAWLLDLDQETVWNGDAGTTEVAGPTRRLGLTFEARAQIVSWLWADLDVSFVNAVYRNNAGNGNAVALAPPWVVAAGLSARHPSGLYGSLRLRAIADRPADPSGTFTAQGFALLYAQLGYRHAWYDIGLHIENLLNSTWREAQFEEDSRLRNEPVTCPASNPMCHTDIKFTAGSPFTATLHLSVFW